MKAIFWFRRDLRISDHPALLEALNRADRVYAVASADLLGTPFARLSAVRQNSLRSSWSHLNEDLNGKLALVQSPNDVVSLAVSLSVDIVYVSAAYDTHGVQELDAMRTDLAMHGIDLYVGPGNYCVAPGTVTKPDGTPYRVYTPFYKAWNPTEKPYPKADVKKVLSVSNDLLHFDAKLELGRGVIAGGDQAMRTLNRFLEERVTNYAELRNRADLGGTSHLSHALSHGEIHPRTILSKLPEGPGAEVFVKEIAWREFYADVLWHNPTTLTKYLDGRFALMRYDQPGERFEQWKLGKTGYPMVDAGMRQLKESGWMHNRVRMIVASFLVKDLHVEWQHGANWFEENLTDFDPASNSHGWQWTAGCGTDASPYYRIFNPISQGLKFDPNGEYVRRWVPELRHIAGADVHEPWNIPSGYEQGYPKPIVDHAAERIEALARLAEIKNSS